MSQQSRKTHTNLSIAPIFLGFALTVTSADPQHNIAQQAVNFPAVLSISMTVVQSISSDRSQPLPRNWLSPIQFWALPPVFKAAQPRFPLH